MTNVTITPTDHGPYQVDWGALVAQAGTFEAQPPTDVRAHQPQLASRLKMPAIHLYLHVKPVTVQDESVSVLKACVTEGEYTAYTCARQHNLTCPDKPVEHKIATGLELSGTERRNTTAFELHARCPRLVEPNGLVEACLELERPSEHHGLQVEFA